MEDIGLLNQGLKWLQSKDCYCIARTTVSCVRDKIGIFMERRWPLFCCGCTRFGRALHLMLVYWKKFMVTGFTSFIGLGSSALLVIMWSFFLSLTSMSCLVYVVLSTGAAVVAVECLGYTPGIFIVGLFGILILWMYANFWITGALFVFGGYLFSLNHARVVVFVATLYAMYYVQAQIGWHGIFLALNLAFLSNDVLNHFTKHCDNVNERSRFEERKESHSFTEELSMDCEYPPPTSEECIRDEKLQKNVREPSKASSVAEKPKESGGEKAVKEDASSLFEMERILRSGNHYEALEFPRHKKIDLLLLKKEYHKKAMLVHPDKNMGSPLASESFKKLQCAYEVLSDAVKKRDYDEQLRKDEAKCVLQKSPTTSYQRASGVWSDESRHIQCTKCGHSHIWFCTNRPKSRARWCQACCQHHQAKDGDGWVEYKGSLVFNCSQRKVEIPRAFVCAESRIFDVSEWAICQGMACKPNTHRPSFHVNMVGLEKSTQRSKSSRYPWDLDAEMMNEEEDDEFELWLQQALASGLFCESSKRRKAWIPFKLTQKKKQWRWSS